MEKDKNYLKAKDVKNIEDSFFDLFYYSPGTKEDKQAYFKKIDMAIPKTTYEIMWNSLVERYGRASSGEAVFDYFLDNIKKREKDILIKSKEGNKLSEKGLMIFSVLFYENGNPRRITELLFRYMDSTEHKLVTNNLGTLKPNVPQKDAPNSYEYDVALSFAGNDRRYVEQVAKSLVKEGIKVFYDKFEKTTLWGKDLYEHLDEIYQKKAKYCIMFLSKSYAARLWTTHERKSAQARAFSEHQEYILPVRFDDTEIPGIRPTVGYIDARNIGPEELAQLINQKCKSTKSIAQDKAFFSSKYVQTEDIISKKLDTHDKSNFLFQTLRQVSDLEVIGYDFENRLVNPDLLQLRYDLESTAKMIQSIKNEYPSSIHYGMQEEMSELSKLLIEIKSKKMYMDGGKSKNELMDLWKEAEMMNQYLIDRVKKHIGEFPIDNDKYSLMIFKSINEYSDLFNQISDGKKPLDRILLNNITVIRRLAYEFNLISHLPNAITISFNLRKVALYLRELSLKNFYRFGSGKKKEIIERVDELEKIMKAIKPINA